MRQDIRYSFAHLNVYIIVILLPLKNLPLMEYGGQTSTDVAIVSFIAAGQLNVTPSTSVSSSEHTTVGQNVYITEVLQTKTIRRCNM